jgi:hypothetical protein
VTTTTTAPPEYYSTNFSEYTTDTYPSDWPERWNGSYGTHTVRSDGDLGGKCLELANSLSVRYFTSWDDPGSPKDVEILAKVRITSSYDHTGRVQLRCSGSGGGSEVGYFAGIQPVTNQIFIHKYTPTSTGVGSASFSCSTNTWYWLRFRAYGNSLKCKAWASSSSEPGSWDVDETDSSITAGGWIGVGEYYNGCDFDWFGVATNGGTVTLPTTTTTTTTT